MPENPPSSSLPIHALSDAHECAPYHPPFPKPPSGRLDSAGLKARIEYGDRLRGNRNITPRTMRFTQWWKKRCSAMLEASPFTRKRFKKEGQILDDEIASRYEKVHGHEGLCHTIVEQFNAMAEMRMMAEYGDHLAYTCTTLKGDAMNDLVWKTEKLDWQAVAKKMQNEEATMEDEKRRRVPTSPTPYLDDVAKAAERLGYEVDLIRYQILAYANRNNFCHSGIKAMIQDGDFQQLAEGIMQDKRALVNIFRERPSEQTKIRKMIRFVEKEWFVRVFMDETGEGRLVKFVLSKRAIRRVKDIEAFERGSY